MHALASTSSSPCCELSCPLLPPISRHSFRRLRFLCPKLAPCRASLSSRSPLPAFPIKEQQFSDAEEEEDDDDEDDEVAAEEYSDGVLVEASEEEEEREEEAMEPAVGPSPRFEEHKWQRVERLVNEVREFGEEILDYEELAGIYDFPIDKFQVLLG